MKHRNPFAVFFLALITLGIYSIYWEVKTKGEMVKRGADIPTAWLIIIPIVNIWWLWKYSEGVEKVTDGKMQGVIAFILLFVLGSIGQAIIQDGFNKVDAMDPAVATSPSTPVTPVPPVEPTVISPIQSAEPAIPAATPPQPTDLPVTPTPPPAPDSPDSSGPVNPVQG